MASSEPEGSQPVQKHLLTQLCLMLSSAFSFDVRLQQQVDSSQDRQSFHWNLVKLCVMVLAQRSQKLEVEVLAGTQ